MRLRGNWDRMALLAGAVFVALLVLGLMINRV